MVIDVIVFIALVLAVIKGLRQGFILAVFSLLAWIIGLAAAIKFSTLVADWLGSAVNLPQRWLPFLAFALVFAGVMIIVRLSAKAIEGAATTLMLGWLNRLGGVALFALLYLFICSVLLFYAAQLGVFKEEALADSVTYPLLAPLAPKVIEGISVVLPFFKDMFASLQQYFGTVAAPAA